MKAYCNYKAKKMQKKKQLNLTRKEEFYNTNEAIEQNYAHLSQLIENIKIKATIGVLKKIIIQSWNVVYVKLLVINKK